MKDKIEEIKEEINEFFTYTSYYGYEKANFIDNTIDKAVAITQEANKVDEIEFRELIDSMFWNKADMITSTLGDKWLIRKKDWNEVAAKIVDYINKKGV